MQNAERSRHADRFDTAEPCRTTSSRPVARRGPAQFLGAGAASLLAVGAAVIAGPAAPALAAEAHNAGPSFQDAVAFQMTPGHTGSSSDPVGPQWSKAWSRTLGGAVSAPIIAGGQIYALSNPTSPVLTAFNAATGAVEWQASEGPNPTGLAYDGGRLFEQSGGIVTAYTPDGTVDWAATLPGQYGFTSAPSASNGIVYSVGDGSGGTMYALSESTGALLWTQSLETGDESSPAVGPSGVYVSFACDLTQAFSPTNGTPLWTHTTGCDGGGGQTSVLADGDLFLRDAILSASTGAVVRSFSSSPAPAVDGNLVYTEHAATLTASTVANGTIRWNFSGDGTLDTAPIVDNGVVYEGSSSGNLYGVAAATGQLLWSTNVGIGIAFPLPGTLYESYWGLAEGDGLLAVPAGDTLTVFDDPGTPPQAPPSVSELAGDAQSTVSWTVPANNGKAIKDFTITPIADGVLQTPVVIAAGAVGSATDPTPGAPDSYVVTGLTNGTTYSFSVAADSSAGTGAGTLSSPQPSSPSAPSAPTGVSASASGTTATVQWTVPANNGSPISSFTIHASTTGGPQPAPFTVPAGASGSATSPVAGASDSYSLVGLEPGVQYTFAVAATNGVGTGPASSPTGPVTTVTGLFSPSSSALNFGPVRVGDIAGPLSVSLENTGDAVATITDAQFAGNGADDFVIDTTCTDVSPGQSCDVDAYFLPGALGQRQATVTLDDGSSTPPALTLDGTGTEGYYEVTSQGVVHPFGDGQFYGSTGAVHLSKPIVGMAVSPDGGGYWLVASDGGIFAFGDAGYYGSTGGIHLNKPIVGMAVTPDGLGYWLVASDGGIFAFGDAGFYGSTGAVVLNKPIVGMAATPDGLGYWLVASDGGIFAFGDAAFYGSTGAVRLNKPIVGMAPMPDGEGYWLVASDGGIFAFGDAGFYGSTGAVHLDKPIVGMAATPDGDGYWLVASDGGIFAFGDAPFDGSTAGQQGSSVIGLVGTAPPTLQSIFDLPA